MAEMVLRNLPQYARTNCGNGPAQLKLCASRVERSLDGNWVVQHSRRVLSDLRRSGVKGAEFSVCPHFERKLSLGVSIGRIVGSLYDCIVLPAPEAPIMRMM